MMQNKVAENKAAVNGSQVHNVVLPQCTQGPSPTQRPSAWLNAPVGTREGRGWDPFGNPMARERCTGMEERTDLAIWPEAQRPDPRNGHLARPKHDMAQQWAVPGPMP
uniref:Uncharacterized protein n=1 Tax=Oryza sativa subsp. japonica TaxID=39947 RepID=Q6Z0Q7_ORYSJ|nr:hypothetical protein [Oryza sativa Japonica Group]